MSRAMPPQVAVASDMPTDTWIDRRLPAAARPYARLIRLDRPIGVWLLLFPGWWTITLASGNVFAEPKRWLALMALFAAGALIMRGAGCVLNDIFDRDFDKRVQRTVMRPLPSGELSLLQALVCLLLLTSLGAALLFQLPMTAVWVGVVSLPLIALYPLMKRVTGWPQAWLGITFNMSALVGWAAVQDALQWPAALIYAGCAFWTLGYDTLYAHQDRNDDRAIGLKSTALTLGEMTKPAVSGFYALATTLFATGGWLNGAGFGFYICVGVVVILLQWQVWATRLDDGKSCLKSFKSNREIGWVMLVGSLMAGLPSP